MIPRKVVVYILTASSLLLFSQPVLAQTYYFGPAGSGITWKEIWEFGRNPSVIGAPSTPFGVVSGGIMNSIAKERATVIVGKKELAPAVIKDIQNSLQKTAKEGLEKAGAQAAEAISKNIKVGIVRGTSSALLKGLGIVTTIEAIAEVVWPADINWQARGWPMICLSQSIEKYPYCYAYFVPKTSTTELWWEALDPSRTSLLGDITQYIFGVTVDTTTILDLAFGRPEPVCAMLRFVPGNSGVKQVPLRGSEVYNNLPPGENKFQFTCFTSGESSIVKKVVQTTMNTVATAFDIVVIDPLVSTGKLLYSFLPGGSTPSEVFWSGDPTPTLTALLDGTYVPPWPIPKDLLHTATATIAVNSPAESKPVTPTLFFSADPMIVTPTRSCILSWKSTSTTVCSASGGGCGVKDISGSEAVTPSTTTTYTITCEGAGGVIERSAKVTVVTPGTPQVDIKGQ